MERFLLALRRMTARRGMCGIIWSDNDKTFKGAKKDFEKCWRIVVADQTQVASSEKKISRGSSTLVGQVLWASGEERQDSFDENTS